MLVFFTIGFSCVALCVHFFVSHRCDHSPDLSIYPHVCLLNTWEVDDFHDLLLQMELVILCLTEVLLFCTFPQYCVFNTFLDVLKDPPPVNVKSEDAAVTIEVCFDDDNDYNNVSEDDDDGDDRDHDHDQVHDDVLPFESVNEIAVVAPAVAPVVVLPVVSLRRSKRLAELRQRAQSKSCDQVELLGSIFIDGRRRSARHLKRTCNGVVA